MKIAILIVATATSLAQNPLARPNPPSDPYVGSFESAQVTLELGGSKGQYSGALTVQGSRLTTAVKSGPEGARGFFEVNGQSYSFTLVPTADGLKLNSDGQEYLLVRRGPASPPAAEASSPFGIVGSWRNATGSARFNPDGTGSMDGQPGRYRFDSNQLTLTGAQGEITLFAAVRGDTLSLAPNAAALASGNAVVLNRVKETAGPGGVRPELVGKWCWISVVNAQQGARQSSQCITLEATGAYTYVGGTDSYNPNGGATSQSADSGVWTATDTTITANSRSGKTTVYSLEKRNHPKNRDPMIVLDGQPFVTFYNKPPW